MLSGDMIEIEDFDICVGGRVESKAIKKAKFILTSRPIKFFRDNTSLD